MNRSPREWAQKSWADVHGEMAVAHSSDLPVNDPHVFTPTYFASDEILNVGRRAFDMYYCENALYGGTAYPSVQRFETEMVEFLLGLLNAPAEGSGGLTTGGTESNVIAVKMARDWARAYKSVSGEPEIVLPRTAHPSFYKASQMLGLKAIRMAKSVDFRADVTAMIEAINPNTIMIVASAPPFPYGVVDPVAEIAAAAESNGLWMHVDCCMGGMFLPFVREFDQSVPLFDFRVPAVKSISTDLHKYGYAPKGVSCLMVRDSELLKYRDFTFEDPVAGFYRTPNIAGTRPAGTIAAAWAVMRTLGWDGYYTLTKELVALRRQFEGSLEDVGLKVCGTPHAAHLNVTSDRWSMADIRATLEGRGWRLGLSEEPDSIWMMVNKSHQYILTDFLRDLRKAIGSAKGRDEFTATAKATYAT